MKWSTGKSNVVDTRHYLPGIAKKKDALKFTHAKWKGPSPNVEQRPPTVPNRDPGIPWMKPPSVPDKAPPEWEWFGGPGGKGKGTRFTWDGRLKDPEIGYRKKLLSKGASKLEKEIIGNRDSDYGIKLEDPQNAWDFMNWNAKVKEAARVRANVMEGMLQRNKKLLTDPQFIKDYIANQKKAGGIAPSTHYKQYAGGPPTYSPSVIKVTDGLKLLNNGGVGIGNGLKFAGALGNIASIYSAAQQVAELNELAQQRGGWANLHKEIQQRGGYLHEMAEGLKDMARNDYKKTPIGDWWKIWLGRQIYGDRNAQDQYKKDHKAEFGYVANPYDPTERYKWEHLQSTAKAGLKNNPDDYYTQLLAKMKEDYQKGLFMPIRRKKPLTPLKPTKRASYWINPLKKKKKKKKKRRFYFF